MTRKEKQLLETLPVGFSVAKHRIGGGTGWQWRFQKGYWGVNKVDLSGTAGVKFTLFEAIKAGMEYLKGTPFLLED